MPNLNASFRNLATALEGVDLDVYREYGKDPLEPIIGGGSASCKVAIFGRDPGREEVRHGLPFIGAGGQKVRMELYRYFYQVDLPNFKASVHVGKSLFWANTVPYKPIGNKAWPMRVKKAFKPLVQDVLLLQWHGSEVITLGREAFFWFSIGETKEVRQQFEVFWAGPERFQNYFECTLKASEGRNRTLRLYPLPHPSPLNAMWYKRFPGLFQARLHQLAPEPPRCTEGTVESRSTLLD